MKRILMKAAVICLLSAPTNSTIYGQTNIYSKEYPNTSRAWKNIARRSSDEFFKSEDAKLMAENVLDYQRCTGGWPKNIAIHTPLSKEEHENVLKQKERRNDSTTDNDATITEMTFLARIYNAQPDERYKQAFLRAVEFILSGQYENGGWPQFWPVNRGDYQTHITYNDNSMAQIMIIIRNLRDEKPPFKSLVDEKLKKRLSAAFDKGIDCILKTQIVVNGTPTVWCQQHDRNTLMPAKARAYELPSFCSAESVTLTQLLMDIENPSDSIKRAVQGAMQWFDKTKLTGIKCIMIRDENGKPDRKVISTTDTEPIWARYYDLDECKPFFCDRDGKPKRDLSEIGQERRGGYSWYNNSATQLQGAYNKWKKKNLQESE